MVTTNLQSIVRMICQPELMIIPAQWTIEYRYRQDSQAEIIFSEQMDITPTDVHPAPFNDLRHPFYFQNTRSTETFSCIALY